MRRGGRRKERIYFTRLAGRSSSWDGVGGVEKDKFDSKAWLVTLLHAMGRGAYKKQFDSKDWLVMLDHGMGRRALEETDLIPNP